MSMTDRNQPLHWQVQWQHVSPMMEALYRVNAEPGMLVWAERQWPLLTHAGRTCAITELDRTEALVRGVSLAHLHFEFAHWWWHIEFEPEYVDCLQPFLNAPDVATLARERYWGDHIPEDAFECLSCAVGCLLQVQCDDFFKVLQQQYASPLQMGLDMMDATSLYSTQPPTEDELYGRANALGFLRWLDERSAGLSDPIEGASN
jgi:hypothetical protein